MNLWNALPVNLVSAPTVNAFKNRLGAGLNGGLFSETMDFRDFPSVLSAVRIAQS